MPDGNTTMNTRVWQAILLALAAAWACEDGAPPAPAAADGGGAASPAEPAGEEHPEELPPPPPEGRLVFVYREGAREEQTEPQARSAGLAVVDLSNYWVPFIFSEQDEGGERLPNEFRKIYRKLANDWPYESRTMAEARRVVELRAERGRQARMAELRAQGMTDEQIREALGIEDPAVAADAGAAAADAGAGPETADAGALPGDGPGEEDHYLEVWGIPPSLSVLRKRALNEIGRPCFADIDFEKIRRFDGFVAYKSNEVAEAEARKSLTFVRQMRAAMEKLGVETPEDLLAHPGNKLSAGLVRIALRHEALAEAQRLLACEGFYGPVETVRYREGGLDWKTHQALSAFERKNRIFAWGFFGNETLVALGRTPAERLYDAFLRVVSERVADSLAIIEDGSATGADGKPATYRDADGEVREVPNLVAEVTAHLVRHLGLGTPEKLIAFLREHDEQFFDGLFVAAPLPQLPPYYSEVMELRAEIDRGDVWYEYPFTKDGRRKAQPRKRMPMTTLFVRWNDQDIPLVTMNTTIGSWRTELAPDGYEYYKYKNSDVGPRVWRDIVAGPVWMPPETTPAGDMIKSVSYRGRKLKVPNYDEFGPWYGSAYGLVAAFHVRPVERRGGAVDYLDNGIRSHGSVDYNSILRRYSHGCHRLYNHLAIRMFDFVLQRRPYRRVGEVPAGYNRQVEVDGETFTINLASRGYRYELVDPVPIEVLRGNIRGSQRSPVEHYMPKPDTEYGPDARFLPEGWSRSDTRADGGVELPQVQAGPAPVPALAPAADKPATAPGRDG
jgi:hypothetical protein